METISPALISENVRWSRKEIESSAAKISHLLRSEVTDFQELTIIFFLEDALHLLAGTLALGQEGVRCILIDPREGAGQVVKAAQDRAVCILTEEKYRNLFPDFRHVIALDFRNSRHQDAHPTDERSDIPEPPFKNLKLHFRGDNGLPGALIDAGILENTFQELDKLLAPGLHDLFMPLPGLPFEQTVVDMLWAFSRKIGLLAILHVDPENLDIHVISEDAFRMEFGLFYFGAISENTADRKGKLDSVIETVKYADEQGFVSIWTPERHFNPFGGLFPNPSVLSAALAMVTKQIQIRCGSIVSPLHHPVRIAEDWSVIDNLSGGRAALSFASGWQCDDFVLNPEKYASRESEMYKQIDIVRKLWRGEQVPFTNGLGKEIEIAIFPKPVQTEIPVWITASGNVRTFIEAGRIGANILTHLLYQGNEGIEEKVVAYKNSLVQNGFDPATRKVTVMVHTFIGKNKQEVKNKVKPPLKDYLKSSADLIKAMTKSKDKLTGQSDVIGKYIVDEEEMQPELFEELLELAFERLFERASLLGTVESASDMLRKLKKAGVDEVACLIDFGLSQEEILNGLSHLSELRKKYDPKLLDRYAITLTHGTADAYDQIFGCRNNGSKHFRAGLRKGIMNGRQAGYNETGTHEKIRHVEWHVPGDEKLSLVNLIDHYADAADISEAFNSIVPEDF